MYLCNLEKNRIKANLIKNLDFGNTFCLGSKTYVPRRKGYSTDFDFAEKFNNLDQ